MKTTTPCSTFALLSVTADEKCFFLLYFSSAISNRILYISFNHGLILFLFRFVLFLISFSFHFLRRSFFMWHKQNTLGTGWYEDNWYEVNLEAENITCTREQMKMAAEGHLTTEALMWNQNVDEKTISGMSSGDFR